MTRPSNLGAASAALELTLFENLIPMSELLAMFKHRFSKHAVYRWVQSDAMPHRRIKGRLWFSKADVIRWWLGRSQ